MHGLARPVMLGQDLDGDLLKTLAAQPLVQLVQAQLRIESEHSRKTDQRLLVAVSLRARVVSQRLESLSTLALLSDACCQRPVLGAHRIVELDRFA